MPRRSEYGQHVSYEELPASGTIGWHTGISWCEVHHAFEIVPPDAFRICFECGHVYAHAEDLMLRYQEITKEMGAEQVLPVEKIFFCQECLHDF